MKHLPPVKNYHPHPLSTAKDVAKWQQWLRIRRRMRRWYLTTTGALDARNRRRYTRLPAIRAAYRGRHR